MNSDLRQRKSRIVLCLAILPSLYGCQDTEEVVAQERFVDTFESRPTTSGDNFTSLDIQLINGNS